MAQQSGSVLLGHRDAVCGDWIGVKNELVFFLAMQPFVEGPHVEGSNNWRSGTGEGGGETVEEKEQGPAHRGGEGEGQVKGGLIVCSSSLHISSTLQLCPPSHPHQPQFIRGVDKMLPRRPVERRCRDAMLAASLPHGGGAHGAVAKSQTTSEALQALPIFSSPPHQHLRELAHQMDPDANAE